jgi:hypothetical protein
MYKYDDCPRSIHVQCFYKHQSQLSFYIYERIKYYKLFKGYSKVHLIELH